MAAHRIRIAVDTPQHAGLGAALDYSHEEALTPGQLVRVPLGRREVAGIVWADLPPTREYQAEPHSPALRPVAQVLAAIPALDPAWLALVEFAAGYYQRGLGELALGVLPAELRRMSDAQAHKSLARLARQLAKPQAHPGADGERLPELNDEQRAALGACSAALDEPAPKPLLLHGVTGSGKTEIYLRLTGQTLARGRQVLVLVPEINLTPQLEARFTQRFCGHRIVAMHSGLTPAQRLKHWLLAHLGHADVVLGTRLAVFAPLPRLGLVVVDEEHDASYKQQEGARYSARDLAVYRAHLARVPVLLGSATPSLETWSRALAGRYRKLELTQRIGGALLPQVRLVDMAALPRQRAAAAPALAPPVLQALRDTLARGEQSLVFLNRRGYAPVLHCPDCSWKSDCPHCSAWRVFHKLDRSLRCHHCGTASPVPRACPACGNLDIQPLGRGTEKLEEQLVELLPGARIERIDADSARRKGQLQQSLAAVHAGQVDVLVGTQMVTKGHDFRRIATVVAVNPDSALFAADFRGPERLFALLMQAAGRAGRDASAAQRSQMWVQTWHPRHALFKALALHDFAAFAQTQLAERRGATLPPYAHLALMRADARDAKHAQGFLRQAAELGAALPQAADVMVYPPVPSPMARVAGIERMQMLVECASRTRLQAYLSAWLQALHGARDIARGITRWAVDVDPLAI